MGDNQLDFTPFAKLSGSGNDFICIDNRHGRFDDMLSSEKAAHFAAALCRRSFGIGADGVIFACQTGSGDGVDIFARFFEADGSEADLCGNGMGCLTYWIVTNGWVEDREIRVLTLAGVARAHRSDHGYVRVCIPTPSNMERDIRLEAAGRTWTCDFVVTGIPHAVVYVKDIDTVDVELWGRAIRHHERFQPRGVNVNFVQVLEEGRVALRTFEFGVEGETLACGTGSAAAAILTATRLGWTEDYAQGAKPVLINSRGGEILKIWFARHADGSIDDVCLETVVRAVFTGILDPRFEAEASDPQKPAQATPRKELAPGELDAAVRH